MKHLIPIKWLEYEGSHFLCLQDDPDQALAILGGGLYWLFDGVCNDSNLIDNGACDDIKIDLKRYCELTLEEHGVISL